MEKVVVELILWTAFALFVGIVLGWVAERRIWPPILIAVIASIFFGVFLSIWAITYPRPTEEEVLCKEATVTYLSYYLEEVPGWSLCYAISETGDKVLVDMWKR